MGTQTKTLAEQVADGIMNLIQETPYKAGDKLPTEKELCESTGAGRNTVREALKILASRNVLEIRQGAGTFVSEKQGIPDDPLGFSMVNDHVKLTKDLLQVRIMLEPQIAALAAQCAKEHEIRELEEILEEMEAAMKKREDYSELDTKFHTKIAQCTHNIVMENLLPVIGKGVAVFAKEVAQTEYDRTWISHRKIFCYIRDHKPFEAEMEMQYHLLYNTSRYEEEQSRL
ncbi:L-lactate utilization operon repressor [uncultured Clostridium sp.]|nr:MULTISPECIES: FCD domain-containing protein [unclassified Clostridium]RHN99480.1 FadR family transcriptional regulator [Clostridium sp. AM22-16AC]RHR03485.1 FadR family transcriptional regulator [Clostridium sp. AF20-17LB]RHW01266.1 FadR family transcriptional regulator [Clostridium sp. OF09-10]SCI78775.1 L-lactate utilization operon repressor [uncultured Clostridium sp.]